MGVQTEDEEEESWADGRVGTDRTVRFVWS